jgi:hypothetical protein
MSLGIGEAGIAVSLAAVAITVLKTKPWEKSNGNGNGKPCPLHSGIEVAQKYLTEKVDEIADDVKKILGKIGGV